MVACQPVYSYQACLYCNHCRSFNITCYRTHPHCLLVVARDACPVPCVCLAFTSKLLYLQQPTIARWLELAVPYLDSSSYLHPLLDQQQEQGEELRIQFFLAG